MRRTTSGRRHVVEERVTGLVEVFGIFVPINTEQDGADTAFHEPTVGVGQGRASFRYSSGG